jgi:hypothetical protein
MSVFSFNIKNSYLQKSQPILIRKMVDNKDDVELVVVEEIELVGYLLYKCLCLSKIRIFLSENQTLTYEKFQVESVDKSRVEMDEMLLMYLEKVIDELDDRVKLMGIKLDEKMLKISFDVEVLLVFAHTLFDKVYTNFSH